MGFFFLIFLLVFDAKEDIYISMGIILIRVFFSACFADLSSVELKSVAIVLSSPSRALIFIGDAGG